MDPIDKLLAEVQAEYQEPKTSNRPQNLPNLPNLQNLLEKPIEKPIEKAIGKPMGKPTQSLPKATTSFTSDRGLDNLLGQVKSEFDQTDRFEAEKRAAELKQEALKQEQIRQAKQAQLRGQAGEWLKSLDPLSDEGFWFEQFAEKYPTRLDAAIAYLEVIPASNPDSQ
jgi:hypothetical protein